MRENGRLFWQQDKLTIARKSDKPDNRPLISFYYLRGEEQNENIEQRRI